MRKPRYSYDAFRLDKRGRSHSLWRSTPGIASEFIDHLPDLLALERKPVVLWCRVSNERQEREGNLYDQMRDGIQKLRAMGFKMGRDLCVFDNVGPSSIHADRIALELAIQEARERGAILVAVHRDRILRSDTFNGRTKTEAPKIGKFMLLRRMAGDVPLATILHPDEKVRSHRIKRGQARKGRRGGRPPSGDQRRLLKVCWAKWRTLP